MTMTSPNDLLCVLCGSSVGRVDTAQSVHAILKAIGDGLPLRCGSQPGRVWHRACGTPKWKVIPEVDQRVGTNASALSRSAVGWSPMGPVWAGTTAPAPVKASGPSPAEVKALAELRADNLRLKAEQAGLVKAAPPAQDKGFPGKSLADLQAELAKVKAEHARLMTEAEAEEATPAPVVAPPPAPAPKAAPVVTAPSGKPMTWLQKREAELAAKAALVQATPAVVPPVLPPPAPPAPVQAPPVVLPPAPVAPPVVVQPVAPVQALPVHGGPVRIPVDRATYAALLRAMDLPADELITMAMDRTPIRLGSTVGPVVVELVLS